MRQNGLKIRRIIASVFSFKLSIGIFRPRSYKLCFTKLGINFLLKTDYLKHWELFSVRQPHSETSFFYFESK